MRRLSLKSTDFGVDPFGVDPYEATQEFERLAETISEWFAPIIRMWRFTKNNSITEGFHRKMKLIQRMAYGYKNFENYRLRVLVLCGVFH